MSNQRRQDTQNSEGSSFAEATPRSLKDVDERGRGKE